MSYIEINSPFSIVNRITVEPFNTPTRLSGVQVKFNWDADNILQRSERGSEFSELRALVSVLPMNDAMELAYEILGAVLANDE